MQWHRHCPDRGRSIAQIRAAGPAPGFRCDL
jgi:hypothetical protein